MDAVTALILLAVGAWCLQIALGWLQIQQFNRALLQLSHNGRVCIGRSAGRFQPRVVLALSLDESNVVTGNFILKGLTIFARPVEIPQLKGTKLEDIVPQQVFPKNKSIQQALTLALANKG
ncbi:transcriptional regulator GutM [Pantoea sp. App145]|uniref:transcriptional regulator GutM n=1 Tax=Pantoea sp. App145 TaxID=3071567 RepID=UPI003A7F7F7A